MNRNMRIEKNALQGVPSLNLTIKLLRSIGSPFVSNYEYGTFKNRDEVLELYDYAIKNKIGLIYLESLNNRKMLEEFELKSKYEEEQIKYKSQSTTLCRISEIFNSSGINYAIFKSIMPFLATPNDVDIVHFGSHKEFERAIIIMLQSDYIEIKGYADTEQCMFHDTKYGGILNPHPSHKDIYDIDLYQKISASYVIYLDKNKLEKYVTHTNISGHNIRVFRPEAELMTIIIHSLIPEMLCTLLVYYATLHYFAVMNNEDIDRFINIVQDNNAVSSVRSSCSIVAELHRTVHGFIPEKIEKILLELDVDNTERELLIKNNFRMPHRYSSRVVIKTLFEKMREKESRNSIIKQMILMCNPRLARWVIYNIIWRRRRDTY